MTGTTTNHSRLQQLAQTLGPRFAERAAAHDADGRFVTENYAELKQNNVFALGVPTELGGGGALHSELSDFLRALAHHCGSTALALSMHTHLVAATVWRHRHGMPGEALLRKVAASQPVLVSTGAGDWIDSVGRAERAPGGYRVSGVKRFGSGVPAGQLLMTSAPLIEEGRAPEVMHFPVPLDAPGVTVLNDWDTLGMRATGSHSIELKDVFVPEDAVAVRRPQGQWHPSFSLICVIALPLVTGVYVGVAERAAELARAAAAPRKDDPLVRQLLGEVENSLTLSQLAWRDMVAIANDYDVEPTTDHASRALIRKTLAANAAIASVTKAVELVGGSAYFRRAGIERLLRDVQAAQFHPLPEKKQMEFTARVALGLAPV